MSALEELKSQIKDLSGAATRIKTLEDEKAALGERVKKLEKHLEEPVYKNGVTPGRLYAEPVDRDLEARRGFKSHAEFLVAVRDWEMGKRTDQRVKSLVVKTVGSDEQTGINDQYGGIMVPPAWSPEFLKVDPEADPMGGKTRLIPMTSPQVKIPARTDKDHTSSVAGGLTVTRRPETGPLASSQMKTELITLDAHGLFGLAYATEEILQDSPQSFAALIAAGFSDQFVYALVKERLFGSGVGEYMGVMNSPALVTVSAETNQTAGTIVYDNILKMRSRCWGYEKAMWIANHDCLPNIAKLSLAVGTGGLPVWMPSANPDVPDMLLGRPLMFTEYTKSIGTTGDIVLVNWSEYLEGIYQPLQSAESIHVRFVNHERAWKFWMRNAGQPWWKTALTPVNSSQTLSPYVALAAR